MELKPVDDVMLHQPEELQCICVLGMASNGTHATAQAAAPYMGSRKCGESLPG